MSLRQKIWNQPVSVSISLFGRSDAEFWTSRSRDVKSIVKIIAFYAYNSFKDTSSKVFDIKNDSAEILLTVGRNWRSVCVSLLILSILFISSFGRISLSSFLHIKQFIFVRILWFLYWKFWWKIKNIYIFNLMISSKNLKWLMNSKYLIGKVTIKIKF